MRSLIPGFNRNYYKDGITPCHTKPFFTEYNVLTVQSIILTNILVFMYKFHHFKHTIPPNVVKIIAENAPKPLSGNENCLEWWTSYPKSKLRDALSFKGPLFCMKYVPEILAQCTHPRFDSSNNIIAIPINSFKKLAKSFVNKIQSGGRNEHWDGQNTPLYYVPGLPRNCRRNIEGVSYLYD